MCPKVPKLQSETLSLSAEVRGREASGGARSRAQRCLAAVALHMLRVRQQACESASYDGLVSLIMSS